MERQELPDAVPVPDAVEQRRDVAEAVPDDENPITDGNGFPLEAAAADWQEQNETVSADPDPDEFGSAT